MRNLLATTTIFLSLTPLFVYAGQPVQTPQQATQTTAGAAFANSLAPTSDTEIVNPTNVNSNAWSSTAMPTAVPQNLGVFSSPITTNSALAAAKSSGLAAFGNQAQVNCVSYIPGTGTPQDDQYCAAVNFMTNNCITPTPGQNAILGNIGTSNPTANTCAGTYGQGASKYNFSSQITSTDPIFTPIAGIKTTATTTVGSTCSTQNVVTDPAKYSTNHCTQSTNIQEYSCSQTLNLIASTIYLAPNPSSSCKSGFISGGYCISSTGVVPNLLVCPSGSSCNTQASQPATVNGTCPSGFTYNGINCTQNTSINTSGAVGGSWVSEGAPYVLGSYTNNTNNLQSVVISGSVSFPSEKIVWVYSNLAGQIGYWNPSGGKSTSGGTVGYSVTKTVSPGQTINAYAVFWGNYGNNGFSSASFNSTANQFVNTVTTTTNFACPTGKTFTGTACIDTAILNTTTSALCPTGYAPSGMFCALSFTPPASTNYSCLDGGAPVNGVCVYKSTIPYWADGCSTYETSSGTTLGNP